MGNHVHFLLKPAHGESLSRIMQWILSVFAIHYNKWANTKGHVWYDRFKSIIINSLQQFLSTFEYITNNPIKAGLCSRPSEYKYSGQYFISINDFSLIEKHPIF
jgi:REP element-mobilizing transposase RayT